MPVVWISDDASFGRAPFCAGVSNGRGEDLNDKFATAVIGPRLESHPAAIAAQDLA